MASTITKIRWWLDSVQGLKAHVGLYREMLRLSRELPSGQSRPQAIAEQLRDQERMIGHCLLHVILVHPVGSGRMYD